MLCFPLALFFGSLGIRYDQRKATAVICTLIAGGLIAFYFAKVGAVMLCR